MEFDTAYPRGVLAMWLRRRVARMQSGMDDTEYLASTAGIPANDARRLLRGDVAGRVPAESVMRACRLFGVRADDADDLSAFAASWTRGEIG